MENILEIRNLTKDFGSFKLDNINISLPKGFIMGFIGPNGAGKTTTLKSILGSLLTDSGEIYVFGKDIKTRSMEVKENIGVVMDDTYFVDEWTLNDIQSAISPFYSNWDNMKYGNYLKQFDLNPKLKLKELSKGMRTKLMIAVALSHDAKLLLLDEPTSGLDPVARDELMDILRDFMLDENRGVFFSSHITSDLEKVADYITFIKDGKIAFTGTKDELMDKYLLVKGGPDDLNGEVSRKLISQRKHENGFEAPILKNDRSIMPDGLIFEAPSIESIMVNIYRGERS